MMKLFMFVSLSLVEARQQGSPVSKVFEMLSDLQAKIIKEGEGAQKTYDEFSAWCSERSNNVDFEIKTGKAEVADSMATIEKETATATSLSTKLEELAASIASDDADLAAATKIRSNEAADFAAEEKDLVEVIATLERAIGIIEREVQNGGAAMVQINKSAESVVEGLSALVDASVLSSADSQRLAALVQSSQESEEGDELGAPAGAVYEGHSDGIVGTLQNLLEKAEAQQMTARKTEQTNAHNYQMLKQSLSDEIKFANSDMDAAKKGKAASEESKATAEGDLAVTQKDLNEDSATQSTLKQDCMTGAEDFQSETKSRGDELKAITTAKQVLQNNLGNAADQTYSFVQVVSKSSLSSGVDLANFEAVRFIRDLAHKEKSAESAELMQLASRMASAMKFAKAGGSDPFAKVKGLVMDMIARLQAEAEKDATRQAYCDKESAGATAKKAEKQALMDKLNTKLDSASAQGAKLKEDVARLQQELAELASSHAEMTKIRFSEKSLYDNDSAEMKQAIGGVQKALSVLRDYYASEDKSHTAATEPGSEIIGLLETVESDFTKGLAEMEASESASASEFERVSEEGDASRNMKGQDVKYKNKEIASLAKSASETGSDRDGTMTELDAIREFLATLDKSCVVKPDTYSEKKARRESEIAGLKDALSILQGESVLIQETSKRTLRGSH